MGPESYTVLKAIFGGGAVLATLLGSWFLFKDSGQTEAQRQTTKQEYGDKWKKIRDTGILELPERIVRTILRLKPAVSDTTERLRAALPSWLRVGVIYAWPVVGMLVAWLQFGSLAALALGLPALMSVTLLLVGLYTDWRPPTVIIVLVPLVGVGGVVSWAATIGLLLWYALQLQTTYAGLVILLASPVLGLFLGTLLAYTSIVIVRRRFLPESGFLFGVGMVISFSTTMIALVVGHYASPDAYVPQTLQMMLSNVVCDGVTLVTTFAILGLAVREKRRWPIPLVIVFDVAVAALLACTSLYAGLIFTDEALSLKQVGYVLIGMSSETQQWEIGPYFWAMHTTFLPTLLYLSLILFTWVGKLVVLPIASIFRRGGKIEKPHHYTAGALFLIAAALFALSWFVGFMEPKPASRAYQPRHSQLEWCWHIPTPAIHFEVIAPDSRVKALL